MAKVKVILNWDGLRELLKSEEMQKVITRYTDDVCERASSISGLDEFKADVRVGRNRVVGRVKHGSRHAFYKNRKDKILQKALWG